MTPMRIVAVFLACCALSCDERGVEGDVGAPCEGDEDCGADNVCGVDAEGTRACVPARECGLNAFGITCAGNFLVGCSANDDVIYVDCGRFFTDQPSPQLTCGQAPCAGACSETLQTRCLASQEGDVCSDALANIFGGGKALCTEPFACVLETEPVGLLQHCREEATTCLPGDAGTCTAEGRALNCFAANLDFALPPSAIECSTFNEGTCVIAADDSAICLVGAGAACDGASIQCAAGLTCVGFGDVPSTFGACE